MSRKHQYVDFKDGVNNLDLLFIKPHLLEMLAYINVFCFSNGIKFQLTSIIRTKEQNDKVKAVSQTHVQGRAFDVSLRDSHGWTYEKIQKMVTEVNSRFSKYGAISSRTGQTTPVYIHKNANGPGIHAHFQVRSSIK